MSTYYAAQLARDNLADDLIREEDFGGVVIAQAPEGLMLRVFFFADPPAGLVPTRFEGFDVEMHRTDR